MLLFSVALAVAQPAAAPLLTIAAPWATFRRRPALRRFSDEVEVGILRRTRGEPVQFLLRRTRTDRGTSTIGWTTTLACPAARDALAAMEGLSFGPDVPGLGAENDVMILDGVGYSLEAPARLRGGGRFTVSSNLDTPLAAWIDSTLKVLEPCWSEKAPGRP